MKLLKTLLGAALLALPLLAPAPARADHIPEALIDTVFQRWLYQSCDEAPECLYPDPGSDYFEFCMKYFLHRDFSQAQLENFLRYRKANGRFSDQFMEEMEMLDMEGFYVGC